MWLIPMLQMRKHGSIQGHPACKQVAEPRARAGGTLETKVLCGDRVFNLI